MVVSSGPAATATNPAPCFWGLPGPSLTSAPGLLQTVGSSGEVSGKVPSADRERQGAPETRTYSPVVPVRQPRLLI